MQFKILFYGFLMTFKGFIYNKIFFCCCILKKYKVSFTFVP